MRRKEVVYSDFYCLNCGNKITIPRSRGFQREKFHRKRLWCIRDRAEVNHVQVRNDEEKAEFFTLLEQGAFVQEAEQSMSYCKEDDWKW